MRKLFMAMVVVLLSASVFTSCKDKKDEPTTPQPEEKGNAHISQLMVMDQYVGRSMADVKADLVKNDWKAFATEDDTLFVKAFDGSADTITLFMAKDTCWQIMICASDANFYKDAVEVFNQMGATHTFATTKVEVNFGVFTPERDGKTVDADLSINYADAQNKLNTNTYDSFSAYWTALKGYIINLQCQKENSQLVLALGKVI